MRHDMKLCDQSGEDQDKAWLDRPVTMEKVKSRLWSEGPRGGEAWAPMDRGNGEERARSRSMDQRGHVMIWSESYHLKKDQTKC